MKKVLSAVLLISLTWPALADKKPLDGTYDARVRTDSGTYRVPVEVEDGVVTHIRWPNGGRMSVRGAEIGGDEATGRNSRGDRVRIELDNLEFEASDAEAASDTEDE